jgi:hypothetical protein
MRRKKIKNKNYKRRKNKVELKTNNKEKISNEISFP